MSDNTCKRIAASVKLGKNVKIYDFTNLYGCEIGDDSKITYRTMQPVLRNDPVFIIRFPSSKITFGYSLLTGIIEIRVPK